MELLVVVAIIGILAVLVMGPVSRAKPKALGVQCMSNLHQQGVALQVFLTSYNCYPMWSSPINGDLPGRWWQEQLSHGGLGIANLATNFYQSGIWRCPAGQPRVGQIAGQGYYGYNCFGMLPIGNWPTNFGIAGHRTENPVLRTPIVESEVVSASDMIAIGESDGPIFMRSLDYDFYHRALRHQNRANVLFCDGHVESPALQFLFADTSDEALRRWNRDHLPHREKLSP